VILSKPVRLSLALTAICGLASAEQGILVVHVSDPQDRPIEGVLLATKGDGSTGAPATRQGRTRIALAAQTRAKTWVTRQIIRPQGLVFVSPWDKRVQVPPLDNESENFVPVVLIERGNRLASESGQSLIAITARVVGLFEIDPLPDIGARRIWWTICLTPVRGGSREF